MPFTLVNNSIVFLLFIITNAFQVRRVAAKLRSEEFGNETAGSEINSNLSKKNADEEAISILQEWSISIQEASTEQQDMKSELQELVTTCSPTAQTTSIKKEQRLIVWRNNKRVFVIAGVVGALILLTIIAILILWCYCGNGWHQLRTLFTTTVLSTSIKSSKKQSETHKPSKALQKQEAPPLNANVAKPLLDHPQGLLQEQPTQEETSKKSLQSSSHPISPISKTVFDEDEPCVNPKKVKFLGNIDQVIKERIANYKEEIITALSNDQIEDLTQNDSEHSAHPLRVKFRDEKCILYVSDDVPTEDDVLDNDGN